MFIRTEVQETRNGKEVICYRPGNSPPISINQMEIPCAKGKQTQLRVENPDMVCLCLQYLYFQKN